MEEVLGLLDPKSPRTKADYLSLSRRLNLPGRCPILDQCERHHFTIDLIQRQCGQLPSERNHVGTIVPMMENTSYVGGDTSFLISNCCPEVGLFERDYMFCGLGGYPLTKAQYDKYLDPQYQILETSHFSQCVEYVNHEYYTRHAKLGAGESGQGATKVAGDLRRHLTSIRDETTKAFVDEAVRCFEAGLYRSAIVMSWLAAVGVLQREVITNYLTAFNIEAKRVDAKWKSAVTTDDLGKLKESEFLDRLVAISMIGRNVRTELVGALNLRNGCGHPNSLKVGANRVTGHLELLLQNVFEKFSV